MTSVFLVLCGIMSVLAYPPYGIFPVLFLTIPFLFDKVSKASFKKSFLYGFIYGFSFGATLMIWVINALFIFSGMEWAIPFIPIGFGLFFGLFWGIPCALTALFAKDKKEYAFMALIGIFEWIRLWFLTGFPWGSVGDVWTACLPILQISSVIGVIGLSVLSVYWFLIPYFFKVKKYKTLILSIGLFVASLVWGYLRISEYEEKFVWGVKLRLVQPNIAQTDKWDPVKEEENLHTLIRLSRKNAPADVTHVLWPETAVPYYLNVDTGAQAMTMMALSQGQILITGALKLVDERTGQLANSVFILNDVGQILSSYDKSHLVPFGEYVPSWLPIRKLVPIKSDLKAGIKKQSLKVKNAGKVGPLICYEGIFSGQIADRHNRPDWLLNVTNDAWYGISAGPYQHAQMSVIRAVEEGLPVIRVANSGISMAINPIGQTISSLPLGVQDTLDVKLPRSIDPTPFSKNGYKYTLLICVFFLLFARKK